MARAMKDSGIAWIGEIPEDWQVRKLKTVATIQTGSTPSKTKGDGFYSIESGCLWIKPENLGTGKPIEETTEYLTYEGITEGRVFPEKTVYVCCIASVGKVGFANIMASCNQQVNAIIFKKMFWKYGYYMTVAQENEYIINASGNVMKIINSEKQSNLFCPYPPEGTQRQIADYLDIQCSCIDAVIERTRASIEEYKKLKQAVITQAVTKGIRPNRPMKDSGFDWIGDIPNNWQCIKFKYIASVKSNLVEPDNYGDYLQVSPENMEKGSGKLLPCRTVSKVGIVSGNHLFYEGQILYSKIRPKLNKVVIAPFDGLCSADIYPIETTLDTRFFVYSLRADSFLSQIGLITEDRVKMPKINQEELGNIPFAVPPSDEQIRIADYLDAKTGEFDSLQIKKEQLIAELETYKKTLIFEYVTGKKEVE